MLSVGHDSGAQDRLAFRAIHNQGRASREEEHILLHGSVRLSLAVVHIILAGRHVPGVGEGVGGARRRLAGAAAVALSSYSRERWTIEYMFSCRLFQPQALDAQKKFVLMAFVACDISCPAGFSGWGTAAGPPQKQAATGLTFKCITTE